MTASTSPAVISLRPGELFPWLSARQHRGASLSEVVRESINRYRVMLAISLPTFSEPEASLIIDSLNGLYVQPEMAKLLWGQVEDSIRHDALDQKWGVDGPALVQRLQALTPFECLAVEDAAERFWTLGGQDRGETLRRVGLIE